MQWLVKIRKSEAFFAVARGRKSRIRLLPRKITAIPELSTRFAKQVRFARFQPKCRKPDMPPRRSQVLAAWRRLAVGHALSGSPATPA